MKFIDAETFNCLMNTSRMISCQFNEKEHEIHFEMQNAIAFFRIEVCGESEMGGLIISIEDIENASL